MKARRVLERQTISRRPACSNLSGDKALSPGCAGIPILNIATAFGFIAELVCTSFYRGGRDMACLNVGSDSPLRGIIASSTASGHGHDAGVFASRWLQIHSLAKLEMCCTALRDLGWVRRFQEALFLGNSSGRGQRSWRRHLRAVVNLVVPAGIRSLRLASDGGRFSEHRIGWPADYSRLVIPPAFWSRIPGHPDRGPA